MLDCAYDGQEKSKDKDKDEDEACNHEPQEDDRGEEDGWQETGLAKTGKEKTESEADASVCCDASYKEEKCGQ